MTTDTTCNGWTNYATWRVNLEICDDLCSEMVGETTFPDVGTLAQSLKNTVEEYLFGGCDTENNLVADYAAAFVDMVDWYEIAAAQDELIESED